MDSSTRRAPSGPEPNGPGLPSSSTQNSGDHQRATSARLIKALRDALSQGQHTPEAILHATADTARLLTGAHGVAIALRSRGLVICRSRSGEIAPELGATLSSDSGISGECLRTAKLLYCRDTRTDPRVDAEVCRKLGIRSVIALPVRSTSGTAGILEAFSSVADAFTEDHMQRLKSLADIVESVHRQELGPHSASVVETAESNVPPPSSPSVIESPQKSKTATPALVAVTAKITRHWKIAAGVAALLILGSILWSGWRETADESLYTQQIQKAKAEPVSSSVTAPNSEPSATASNWKTLPPSRAAAKAPVRNAAEIESIPPAPSARENIAASTSPPASRPDTLPAADAAPDVIVAASDRNRLSNVISAPATVPSLDVTISQGVTAANLIHKVVPVYPQEARLAKLQGSVKVSALIGEDGSVQDVRVLAGPSALAASAVAAIRQWRYGPTFLNGKPTPVQREITVVYKLP